MVEAKEVKRVMSVGELAIRLEKRWVTRDSLVQQIGRLEQVCSSALLPNSVKERSSASQVKIVGHKIRGRVAL